MKQFWSRGEPFIWATSVAMAAVVLMALCLFGVILSNGARALWPKDLERFTMQDGAVLLGEIHARETVDGQRRLQLKTGNRDLYGLDFRWIEEAGVKGREVPNNAVLLERREYGDFFGFIKELRSPLLGEDHPAASPGRRLKMAMDKMSLATDEIKKSSNSIAVINNRMSALEHRAAKLRHRKAPANDPAHAAIDAEKKVLDRAYAVHLATMETLTRRLEKNVVIMEDAGGTSKEILLLHIVRVSHPNTLSIFGKFRSLCHRLTELLFDEPRESNTEGGLFPAIFGTVMLIFIMSVLSFPLGVVAGIFLREYARDGMLVRMVRIAVNNLAGIPSIVYGIFGLGFFVYGIGGGIDRLFFPELLPTPTFGTGGILWASLTLGLLTVPVVIVSTEEALGAIPNGIREGSLALGATKFQVIVRTLLPMASPGILTGFILSMARAAGEVAPLMITGVVKLAPALPVDGQFPFVHLDRKFMHLGFHIYDVGFQSPNVEAAKPMVYVTTLLLLLIVIALSSFAITLRNRMRKRYSLEHV